MKDEKRNLRFNGLFCKMKEWVEFSKQVGVDYHVFEAKLHDRFSLIPLDFSNYWTIKLFSILSSNLILKEN